MSQQRGMGAAELMYRDFDSPNIRGPVITSVKSVLISF